MKLKTTLALVAVAIAVGIIFMIDPWKDKGEIVTESPWFYKVAMEDIVEFEIDSGDNHIKFVKVAPKVGWTFEDPKGIPPAYERWGGQVLLLSGPMTRRDLTEAAPIIEDPAQYGLDDPKTIVDVGLTADRHLQFRLGDNTTDGSHVYGEVVGFPQLFIIAESWGRVLSNLAANPPYPTWWQEREPGEIIEVNIYGGDPRSEGVKRVKFAMEEDEWLTRDYSTDSEDRPLDDERWGDILPLLSGPSNISVAELYVDDADYTPWGLTDDSISIELRYRDTSQLGTTFIGGYALRVGAKTPDGQGYYAQILHERVWKPVLLMDAAWTEALLGAFEDVPYAS
jgi:hypothetical protein